MRRQVSKPKLRQTIYGIKPTLEAIYSRKTFSKIFISKSLKPENNKPLYNAIKENHIPFSRVPPDKLKRMSKANHQGVIAHISPITYVPIEEIVQSCFERGVDPKIFILDRIEDTRNLGAIVRSAVCNGFDGIVIPTTKAAQITSDTYKTSAGALSHILFHRTSDLHETINSLKGSGLKIISLSEKSDTYIYDEDLNTPVAFILGNEETGVDKDILKLSDQILKIPIIGRFDSFNVSNAAAIAGYESARQTLSKK